MASKKDFILNKRIITSEIYVLMETKVIEEIELLKTCAREYNRLGNEDTATPASKKRRLARNLEFINCQKHFNIS